jgi:uncharacterized protein YegJ (DUF2314 family)
MKQNMMGMLFAVLLLGACSREDPTIERQGEPPVTMIEAEDEQMNAAMQKARVSLDEFERRLTSPPSGQSYISLKGRFEENGAVEHIWLSDLSIVPGGYRGKIGNEPVNLHNIRFGQQVELPRERVSDWLAIEDDTLIAGYTLRVLRERMTPEERSAFDSGNGFKVED